jgi:phosphopantothenate---cysteine ligase (CTP)
MKILITSGGTKIPVDVVRSITNMSSGTFGSKIATELLEMGHNIYFFKAKNSKSPFQYNCNFFTNFEFSKECFNTKMDFVRRRWNQYNESEYSSFDEYKSGLENVIKTELPDIVILAAAVSDYGVNNPVRGKVRTTNSMGINLTKLPKLIGFVKNWHPNCKLVGFKLLVNSSENELIDSAKRSIIDNNCDMVVANDLQDIKTNNHQVHLVFPTGEPIVYKTNPIDPNYLAKMVAKHTIKL